MILLIDNYDSFVHNLARYFERLGQPTRVVRNDAITSAEVKSLVPQAIVLSPGPCTPVEAGICEDLVRQEVDRTPILGICLGHQAIATALGGRVVRSEPRHGLASSIEHDQRGLFQDIPSPTSVARYHSLVVEEQSLPPCLEVSARSADKLVMAVRHRQRPVIGLQFHPESILTDHGFEFLRGFLRLAKITPPSELPAGEYRPTESEVDQQLIPPPIVPICF